MSWCLYLLDKKKRLAFELGRVSEEDVDQDMNLYDELIKHLRLLEESPLSLDEIELKSLNLNHLLSLLNSYEMLKRVVWIKTPLFALDYLYRHKNRRRDFEFVYDKVPEGFIVISL